MVCKILVSIPCCSIPYHTIIYAVFTIYHTILQGSLCLCGLSGPYILEATCELPAPDRSRRAAAEREARLEARQQSGSGLVPWVVVEGLNLSYQNSDTI